MQIITVIPLEKGPLRENLTYFSAKNVPPGSIVSIPFRNKKILGLAISAEDATDKKSGIKNMSFNLRKILEVKEDSIFRKEYLDSALATGNYFAANDNNSVTSLIPVMMKDNYDKIAKWIEKKEIKENTPENNKNIRTEKLLFQASLADRLSYYKTMIRGSFALKKSVFIVLPTERDIENLYKPLSKGIENFAFFIHGGMSEKKTLDKVKEIVSSKHPVLVLGTAPFLSLPRNDFKTIIVEHESSKSYRMIARPYFDLRTFVEIFAVKIKAKFILADTLLRFETIERRESDGFSEVHPLSFRLNFGGKIEIVSKEAKTHLGEKFRIFTEHSKKEITEALSAKKNIFIFSLRKGLATMTVCRDCSETILCPDCRAPVVLYLSRDGKKRMFVCNRCKEEMSADTACTSCGSWNLLPLGIGTDTVLEEINTIFPETKTFKLDKESAKTAKQAEGIVKEFEKSEGAILVGTEMAFSYLNEKVPLSIIASFDSLSSIPNFRMNEKIIQLIYGMIEKTKNRLIIETKNERDPAILAVKKESLLSFVREELADRRKFEYPPFVRFIKIKHLGDRDEALKAKAALTEVFKEYEPEIFSGFVAKSKGQYITNTLLKVDLKKWSLPEISAGSSLDQNLLLKLLSMPSSFEISVDPEDLL